ncbi:hypothetical protein ACPOL_4311 [Acidisarcina polymorpha]|uniref:Uncharacterized protein n=1 Tax=Acidisarcina polymorpha TaxID=2211140 RepID=A0A2Z5G4X9_9BACT|nr:hypothetical protein ACPOL_4311 [Acidisarcina polymorpha]
MLALSIGGSAQLRKSTRKASPFRTGPIVRGLSGFHTA